MDDKIYIITSPVMGTFYRASAPDKPPLARVGQKIKASILYA